MLARLYAFRQTAATLEADHGGRAASARDPDGANPSGNPAHYLRSSRRYLRSSTLLSTELDALTSGATGSRELRQKRPRPESGHSSLDESDAKGDALRPQSGTKSVTAPDRVGSHRFVQLARNPPNAAWLCRSLRAGTTTCDSSQWAERDSNPLRFTAGFEGSGAKRRRKRHTGARRDRRGGPKGWRWMPSRASEPPPSPRRNRKCGRVR